MNRNSEVEDAILQIKNLEEALNKNAQGILASTMKEEISQLVKESLKEQDDEVEDEEGVEDEEEIVTPDDEDVDDVEDDEDETDLQTAPGMGMTDPEMFPDTDASIDSDDETIDLTKASDSDVLKVFKLMSDDDGIVVTKDEDRISIKDGENEYLIKLNEEISNEMYNLDEIGAAREEHGDNIDLDSYCEKNPEDYFCQSGNELELEEMYGSRRHRPNFERDEFGLENDEDEFDFEEDEFNEGFGEPYPMDETLYEISLDEEDIPAQNLINPDLVKEYGDPELEEWAASEYGDYEREFGIGDSDYDSKDEDDTLYEISLDEYSDDLEEDAFGSDLEEMMYESKGFTPKGRVGKMKKVNFTSNTKGGFNEKRKEAFGKGVKAVGTGKAKFDYKDGENLDGDFRIKPKRVETKEASRFVKSVDRKVKRGLMAAPKQLKEEVEMLRVKNGEYRKALDLFRTKLNEVAVFNSNLAYATRLFTEHSTTKQEKINILRRFDNVETLKESKSLYRVIKDELSDENTGTAANAINESIDRTVNKTVSSGSAVNLIESKTYENPQFLRMKDLMTKIK
jgi:hypothetical protein